MVLKATSLRAVLLSLSLAACQAAGEGPMTAGEAIDIANAQMARDWPQVPLERLTIETEDRDTHWRVTYRPPYGSTGGPLIMDIDKGSGRAAWVSVEQ